MKFIFSFLLFFLFFFVIIPSYAFADITSYQWATSGSVSSGTYGNTQVLDNTWSVSSSVTSWNIIMGTGFPQFTTIPSGSTINGFWYKVRIKSSVSGILLFPRFSNNSGSSYYTPAVTCSGQSGCPFEPTTDMVQTTHFVPNNGIIDSDLNTSFVSGFRFSLIEYGSSASYVISLDQILVAVDYTPPGATPTPTPISNNIFGVPDDYDDSARDDFYQLLDTKAPFAYVRAAFNDDSFSDYEADPSGYGSQYPQFNFPLVRNVPDRIHPENTATQVAYLGPIYDGNGTIGNISNNYGTYFTNYRNGIKNIFSVVLYFFLLVYFVFLGRRVFSQ